MSVDIRLLLLLGLGGGLGDLDVGELILADGADGVGIWRNWEVDG